MKEIQAIIQPFKLSAVTDALQVIPGVGGITAMDVRGFGHQRGENGLEKPAHGSVNYTPKVMLVLAVPDAVVAPVLAAIERHAHTGNPGDGKVLVLPVEDALRVRTGERGEGAL
ncbi:P-II family nitrogen regulator [Pyxidicoccus sp. MSG2]|uniref:P-II family nitrogen regulator n=1 Tax=Pyxidicoccus sp. MSG2 TaxID=2996790 RepID=UPI00226D5EB5|nr:P-II family nitrogen regulator [Pyxidicoccus sp. MSG2]MCY1024045.1 P-II family nitrogen regulator [Pyxidicoccus sp. MSG2]